MLHHGCRRFQRISVCHSPADQVGGGLERWDAVDLLAFNGRDLRPQPLVKRQAMSASPVGAFRLPRRSRYPNPSRMAWCLRAAEQRGFEGVVSKRREAPYRVRVGTG